MQLFYYKSMSLLSLVQRVAACFVAFCDTQDLNILREEARGQQAVDAKL